MASDFEYSAVAIEHARNPRNRGALDAYDGHARVTGPCGDTMEFWFQVRDGRIHHTTFTTDGCGSSLACGSMTTQLATGKTAEEACVIRPQDVLDALGGFPQEFRHCALLAVDALRAACEDYLARRQPDQCDGSARSGSCNGRGSAKARRHSPRLSVTSWPARNTNLSLPR
jgi:nitrogen fixation NifU-like protein